MKHQPRGTQDLYQLSPASLMSAGISEAWFPLVQGSVSRSLARYLRSSSRKGGWKKKAKPRDLLISENSSRVSLGCGTGSPWWHYCWVWIDFFFVSRLSTKQPFLWVIFSLPPFQIELTAVIEILLYFFSFYLSSLLSLMELKWSPVCFVY